MQNISEHISYSEATVSQNSVRLKIDNTPTPEILDNMRRVALECFERARAHFGPIVVSSFYRCPELNRAIGGVDRPGSISQHTKGQAIDMYIDSPHSDKNLELYNWCLANLDYDQLINEFPDDKGRPCWVHVSYVSHEKNRKMHFTVK